MDKDLFELAEATVEALPDDLPDEEEAAAFMAAAEPPLPPPARVTMDRYERSLADERASLRQAIAALDQAFRAGRAEDARRYEQRIDARVASGAEPSFADLVSETALRRAG